MYLVWKNVKLQSPLTKGVPNYLGRGTHRKGERNLMKSRPLSLLIVVWQISCGMSNHEPICGIRNVFVWEKDKTSKCGFQLLNLFLHLFQQSLMVFMVHCKIYKFTQSFLNWMFCLIFKKNHSELAWKLYSVSKNTLISSHYCKFYKANTPLYLDFSSLSYILLWLCLYFIAFYVMLQNSLQNIWQ